MAITQQIDKDGSLIASDSYYHSTSSSSTASNDTLDKTAFLNLLVAEMKYQDPLEPSSNTDYVAQLATFSQVESMQNMQLTYQQQQGATLVGQPVIMKTETSSGETGFICGRVEYMITQDSKVYLSVNGALYDIDDLDTVLEEEYYQENVLGKTESSDTAEDSDTTEDATDTTTDTTEGTEETE